jgi:hypothetical protein
MLLPVLGSMDRLLLELEEIEEKIEAGIYGTITALREEHARIFARLKELDKRGGKITFVPKTAEEIRPPPPTHAIATQAYADSRRLC